jgi:hypothetical protein
MVHTRKFTAKHLENVHISKLPDIEASELYTQTLLTPAALHTRRIYNSNSVDSEEILEQVYDARTRQRELGRQSHDVCYLLSAAYKN